MTTRDLERHTYFLFRTSSWIKRTKGIEEKREKRYRSTLDFLCTRAYCPTFRKERKVFLGEREGSRCPFECFAFPRRTQNGFIPQTGTRVLVFVCSFLVFLIRKATTIGGLFVFLLLLRDLSLLITFAKLDSFVFS